MPAQEEWKPVVGFPDYMVSDRGRVVSHKRGRPHLMRPRAIKHGYLQLTLSSSGQRSDRLVHRLVLEAFVGPCADGQETRHINGRTADNWVENLQWGTRSENMRDQVLHGTHHLARKTHCKSGHPFDGENTDLDDRGYRSCRTCKRTRSRIRMAQLRAAASAVAA